MEALLFLLIGSGLIIAGAQICGSVSRAVGENAPVIGLLAIVTSLPELSSSLSAMWFGRPNLAFGIVIGSNIANILLFLALAAFSKPFHFLKEKNSVFQRNILWLFLTSITAWGFSLVSFFPAITFSLQQGLHLIGDPPFLQAPEQQIYVGLIDSLCLFIPGLFYVMWSLRKPLSRSRSHIPSNDDISQMHVTSRQKAATFIAALLLISGGIILANFAVQFTNDWSLFLGMIPLAVITSIPEGFVTWHAHAKGKDDLAFGNIVESNIFNILVIFGLSSLIANLAPGSSGFSVPGRFDISVMIIILVFVTPLISSNHQLDRKESLLSLGFYLFYAIYVALHETPDYPLKHFFLNTVLHEQLDPWASVLGIAFLISLQFFLALFLDNVGKSLEKSQKYPLQRPSIIALSFLVMFITVAFSADLYGQISDYVSTNMEKYPPFIEFILSRLPINEILIFLIIFASSLFRLRRSPVPQEATLPEIGAPTLRRKTGNIPA